MTAKANFEDIFGGSDSELDDVALSDDEPVDRFDGSDDDEAGRRKLPSFKKAATVQNKLPDDIRPRPRKQQRKPARNKRRSENTTGSGSEEEAQLRELSPASRLRQQANDDVDAAMKKGKKKRAVLQEEAEVDEIAVMMLNRMRETAEADKELNRKRRPAVEKLKALPETMTYLSRQQNYDQYLENHILEGIKAWLEPLPDASLPSLDIQMAMFDVLGKMHIDTTHLRESLIGRIVNFYAKCPRVSLERQKTATQLVDKWMRPILNRSNSYRDYSVAKLPEAHANFMARAPASPRPGAGSGEERSNRARIPPRIAPAFTVVPESQVTVSESKPKVQNENFRRIELRMKGMKAGNKAGR
ncbi:Transcription factor iws1 [Geranomyces michiganensis]|nr:Transcription factor iws1 [Geranomyces michiganensis]